MNFSRMLLLLSSLTLCLSVWGGTPYEETIDERRGFRLFGGPTREGPEAQWARVEDFIARERIRAAIRHSRYLVNAWPDHPRAVDAQRMIADLQFARENYEEAFQAYQELIDNYAGMFNYNEILEQQLICAERVQAQSTWALFGRYNNPENAVPLYRQFITNAPHLEITPELIHRIGEILMEKRKYAEAIQEYDLLEDRYPQSPYSVKAAFRRAEAFAKIAERHPTDLGPSRSALAAFSYFVEAYPHSEQAETAMERREHFYNHLAAQKYEQARFYEENMRRPDAALATYEAVISQFPDSSWTEKARERINRLNQPPEE